MEDHKTTGKPRWRPGNYAYGAVIFFFSLEVYQRLGNPAVLQGTFAALVLGVSLLVARRTDGTERGPVQARGRLQTRATLAACCSIATALVLLRSSMTGKLFVDFVAEDNQVWNGAIYRATSVGEISFSMPGTIGPFLWLFSTPVGGVSRLLGADTLASYDQVWLVQFLAYSFAIASPAILVARRLQHGVTFFASLLATTSTVSLTLFIIIPALTLGHMSAALVIVAFASFLLSHQGFQASLAGCLTLISIASLWVPLRTISPALILLYLSPLLIIHLKEVFARLSSRHGWLPLLAGGTVALSLVTFLLLKNKDTVTRLVHEIKMLNSYGGGTNEPQQVLIFVAVIGVLLFGRLTLRAANTPQLTLTVGLIVIAATNILASAFLTGSVGYAATKFAWITTGIVGLAAFTVGVTGATSASKLPAMLVVAVSAIYFAVQSLSLVQEYDQSINAETKGGWQHYVAEGDFISGCIGVEGAQLFKGYTPYLCSRHMMAFNGVPGLREWNLGWYSDVDFLTRLQQDPREFADQVLMLNESGRPSGKISVRELTDIYILKR